MSEFTDPLELQRINLATELVNEQLRPSSMYRPHLFSFDNKWIARLQVGGVCGFGDSPHAAYVDFDRAWYEKLKPIAVPAAKDTHNG